jgi:hypothetical protein
MNRQHVICHRTCVMFAMLLIKMVDDLDESGAASAPAR